ncbi:glyoxalase [Pseudooceanicola sp. 216_PA32_1]|uniref:Glyoxalase n=1 Tax=Pseudooceanicola pacificus TaxID=2676438 RepID=A0A844WFE8_9RHOB|nr:VOC family protein [Pseudooceanicola pacificus]MWB79822.1 glyoxalase [Pseudooceanicola pacificus]
MLQAIHHVQLAMPEGGEDLARGFYSALLGLPEVAKPPRLAARGGCWFETGALRVHLGVEGDFRPARKAHPAFAVTDLPALVARLEAADVAVLPDDAIPGVARVYVADPFGNRIELIGT